MFVYPELEKELKLGTVLRRCPEWYVWLSEISDVMIIKEKNVGGSNVYKNIILEVLLNLYLKNSTSTMGILNHTYIRGMHFCTKQQNKSWVDDLKAFNVPKVSCAISNFHVVQS